MSTKIGLGPTSQPRRLSLGDMRLTLLDGSELWLDGGAMFGIIPKPLWSRVASPDESNRIPLATTCCLVETDGQRILIETGCGAKSKYNEKEQGIFRFSDYWLIDSLAAAGVDPGDIDVVILTHLHFDHAGGGTTAAPTGGFAPTFPNARYVVQRGEWDDAVQNHAVMTATYRSENLAPLESAGVISLVDGIAEIAPGVSVSPLPGHTRHQQAVRLTGGGKTVIQPADLMPTSAHAGMRYNMAYDLLPYENMCNKARLMREAAADRATLLLGQDPNFPLWTVESDAGRTGLKCANSAVA